MQRRTNRTKKSSTTQNTGQLGVNLVEKAVLDMKFVWNPQHYEFGIDGIIEVIETATGTATNRIVQVQVKATIKEFPNGIPDTISFPCDPEHIDYWLGGTAPVILVFCHLPSNEAYWMDVKAYFNNPVNQKTNTIRFDRVKDRFTPSIAPLLANLAQPKGGLHLGPLPKREQLISNLLPLMEFPKTIWSGTSKHKGREEFYDALRALRRPDCRELFITNNTVYSFLDLSKQPLASLIEPETIETNSAEDWALTENPDLKRNFVQLLNCCLRQFCFDQKIGFIPDKKLHYFLWENKRFPRKIKCQSLQKAGKPSVAEWHASALKEGDGYFRHKAIQASFVRFGDRWFLEIMPDYHYTSDGRAEYWNSEALLSGIKELDRQAAVRGQILLWKSVFTEPDLTKRYKLLRFDPPLTFEIKTGIDDNAWKKTGTFEVLSDEDEAHDQTEDDQDSDQLQMPW